MKLHSRVARKIVIYGSLDLRILRSNLSSMNSHRPMKHSYLLFDYHLSIKVLPLSVRCNIRKRDWDRCQCLGSYPGTDIDPEIVNIVDTISLLFWG